MFSILNQLSLFVNLSLIFSTNYLQLTGRLCENMEINFILLVSSYKKNFQYKNYKCTANEFLSSVNTCGLKNCENYFFAILKVFFSNAKR